MDMQHKSLHEYTTDDLLAEIRRRKDFVPSNAGQYGISDCKCPAGYEYGGCQSSGCIRRTIQFTPTAVDAVRKRYG